MRDCYLDCSGLGKLQDSWNMAGEAMEQRRWLWRSGPVSNLSFFEGGQVGRAVLPYYRLELGRRRRASRRKWTEDRPLLETQTTCLAQDFILSGNSRSQKSGTLQLSSL